MKILCFLPNYIGDILMTTPAIRVLKKYTDAYIYVVLKERLEELIEDNPNITGIIKKNKNNRIKTIKEVLSLKPNYVILFRTTFFNSLVAFLSSANVSVGINQELSWFFLNKTIKKDLLRPYRFECLFLVKQLLSFLNINIDIDTSELKKLDFFGWGNSQIKLSLEQKLSKANVDMKKKFIVVSPLASRITKVLTSKQYIQLFNLLYEKYSKEYEIILVSNCKNKLIEEILTNTGKKIKFLLGETNLKEVGYLFSISSLVISPDSGPAYISESVGTKTFIYFTSTLPEKYGPYSENVKYIYFPTLCSPCYKDICPNKSYSCINNLNIKEMFNIIEKILI